jgi:hypothetical protein
VGREVIVLSDDDDPPSGSSRHSSQSTPSDEPADDNQSVLANRGRDAGSDIDIDEPVDDGVTQEEGYISPYDLDWTSM